MQEDKIHYKLSLARKTNIQRNMHSFDGVYIIVKKNL
jgi:hypothetical protein